MYTKLENWLFALSVALDDYVGQRETNEYENMVSSGW